MFTDAQQALIREPVFGYFHDICQVPRPSFHEERISDFLLSWAQERGFAVEQDAQKNILIRKSASPGYEAAPALMLQAHMDMVCEKTPKVDHDFMHDPITWQIDGDWITTGGRTTFGADNGIGMAMAMAALTDEALTHPMLEVLFTTAEEEDLSGAMCFDMQRIQAHQLINLDHAAEEEILCGSCGGRAAEIELSLPSEPMPDGWMASRLTVQGLVGGHSGEDIHRGHGNAIVLLARLMDTLTQYGAIKVQEVSGGTFRLAIPREATAVVVYPATEATAYAELIQRQAQMMAAELSATGENLLIQWESATLPATCYDVEPLLNAVFLSPDGIAQMNESLVGLVDTSDNLGELTLKDGALRLVFEIRSARSSMGEYLYRKMERLTHLLGGSCHSDKGYPSWHFVPQSALRALAEETYQELFDKAPRLLTVHAGIEVGFFCEKRPDLDAIAIGPTCLHFHSPTEAMSISSVRNVYRWLCALIQKSALAPITPRP